MDIMKSNPAEASAELHDTSETILKGEGLKRYYERGAETVKALDGVDIDIKKGEMIAFVGPSGAGKTTLMNILSLLDQPTEGKLTLKDRTISGLDEEKLAVIRRENMGFVFQRFYLVPTLTVLENVEMPLTFSRTNLNREVTNTILATVGLSDRKSHFPRELSGGQMQRVAIARALIGNPSIIIADEPTGNLDSKNSRDITEIFHSLSREKEITVIISTHDMSVAEKCDRIVHILDGKVEKVV